MLEKSVREVKFTASGITTAFANAFRRIATNEIPVLAVDSVDFFSNESVLYNEVLAHRLALIPFAFDAKAMHTADEHEEGKTCSNCMVVFVLDKKGPCMVYAKDLKSSNEDVKPVYDDIPIVELFDKQKLKLEAKAILGYGFDHAKCQAAIVNYRLYPKITVKNLENPEEVMKASRGMITIKGGKADVSPDFDLSQEASKIAKPEGALKIEGEPGKFIFSVESVSGLNAEQIIAIALDRLKKLSKDFKKSLDSV